LDYRANFGTAIELMQRSAQLMGMFLPHHEWQEAQNKLEAFRLFAYADQELRFPKDRLESLDGLTRRALALGNYHRIWALEGVAHYYVGAVSADGRFSGILANPGIPECAMVSMHAGMGTSLAGTLLARLGGQPSRASLRDALERHFQVCRENARPGWYENAIEPMGLGVRSLHPHLLAAVSTAIGEIDSDAQRLFWHGVGRSLYFVPTNFITFGGSHKRALRTAISEAPTPEDQQNAVAGLVWAVTLVNIRHPVVLKNLLRACAGIRMPEAVVNGIVSALMVWKHMVPEDSEFLPVYSRPLPASTPDAKLWNDCVAAPTARAFAELFPALNREGRIASVFQYRPLQREQTRVHHE